MLSLQHHSILVSFFLFVSLTTGACARSADSHLTNDQPIADSNYHWIKVTEHAPFPGSYNFPLFNIRNKLWAFHSQGNWYSADGKSWTKAELPPLGLRTGFQQYVQLNDAIYALGTSEGNYLDLSIGSRIARTSSDLKRWEVVAEQSELPARVFYGAVVFNQKIWLLGGFDGKNYYNDVWNSSDGVKWRRIAEKSPWSARTNPSAIVFQDKIWLIGGGIINGQVFNDVWHTEDGVNWKQATDKIGPRPIFGGSAIVFVNRIWLVGVNRNDGFQNAVLVSGNGELDRANRAVDTERWSCDLRL
ncbi:MAG TPA: kelch repeat-containing protein [Pyrinomonadaceae bacterium]|nr:kelch repeat-containing protein [Pyrinomonadaceae bacterium]